MKRLHHCVNIVPVIAKADTLTIEERDAFKLRVSHGRLLVCVSLVSLLVCVSLVSLLVCVSLVSLLVCVSLVSAVLTVI